MLWIAVPIVYLALIFLPSWVAVAFAIPVALLRYGYIALIPAGILLDYFYGAGNFHYFYTALFTCMVVIAAVLRSYMADI